MRPDHQEFLRAFYWDVLKPPPRVSVSEWVEENVVIPPGAESTSGAFSFHRVPYAREPLECYAGKSIRDLVLVFGTQCIKTTILRCGALYVICNDPMPCVWFLPNEKPLALSFSKNRWIPLVLECKAALAHLPRTEKGKIDRYRFGFLEQKFGRMTLNFVGSNSPANLSSRPAGFLQMDEVDKYGQETEFEPGALNNAEERAKNFPFSLIVKSSTPTVATHGIWPQFLLTDQRYYYVPCPRCGEGIVLKFRVKSEQHGDCGLRFWRECADEVKRNGQWDLDAVAQAAHYRCQLCGGEIGNGERTGMVQAGIWRPHNPNAKTGRRGYHLSSLYSLVSNECTISAIAVSWCEATGDMGKRHRIIDSTFAEPWNVEKGFDERQIATEDYVAPPTIDGVVKIMTIDFQLNHFWVVIRAWAPITPEKPKGESWLILATKLETIDEIKDQQEQHCIAGENVALDIAGRPNQAGQIILENGWRGLQGSDAKKFPHRLNNGLRIERIYSEVQLRDAHQGTRAQGRIVPFPFLYWAKDPVRDLVATLRFLEPTIWHVHSTAHPAYQRHLNAHVKLQRIDHKSGAPVDYWKELHNDDHLWDCECMNAVLAIRHGFAPLLGSSFEQRDLFQS